MFPTKKKTKQLVLRRALLLLTLFIALPCIAHSQTASPCTGSQLSVKDEHSDNAMGGQRGEYYSFKNNAPSHCTLKGSPGFVLLGRAGYVADASLAHRMHRDTVRQAISFIWAC